MLAGGRGYAELAMAVLANDQAFEMRQMREADEAPKRPDPIGAETQHVSRAAADQPYHVGLSRESLVGRNRARNASSYLGERFGKIMPDRRFAKVDVEPTV